jgi:hypothetical protein
VLRGNGLTRNVIFDRSSPENRDDCFAPYALMKERLRAFGYELDTADLGQTNSRQFELHQDVQSETDSSVNYLLMLETEFVRPENGNPDNWAKYRKIFTWNDLLVDGERFIKVNPPNPITVHAADGFSGRDRFCCLISSNKTLPVKDARDLYPERVNTIRWFEAHAPEMFDLYGNDWDKPVVARGLLGKVQRRFWRQFGPLMRIRPFPSYRGRVAHKSAVMARTRFSICYENISDVPGYITEKIFDSFFSGCVPVYWGANNILDYVPVNCFVDRRQFQDHFSLFEFLNGMTEDVFIGYQQRIAAFLASEAAFRFSSEFFAETIATAIVQDIGA